MPHVICLLDGSRCRGESARGSAYMEKAGMAQAHKTTPQAAALQNNNLPYINT